MAQKGSDVIVRVSLPMVQSVTESIIEENEDVILAATQDAIGRIMSQLDGAQIAHAIEQPIREAVKNGIRQYFEWGNGSRVIAATIKRVIEGAMENAEDGWTEKQLEREILKALNDEGERHDW